MDQDILFPLPLAFVLFASGGYFLKMGYDVIIESESGEKGMGLFVLVMGVIQIIGGFAIW